MLRDLFPNLNDLNHKPTSPQTALYNCIAWSVETQLFYLWPDEDEEYYWPDGITREATPKAFREFYALMGYEECSAPNFEIGFEKVALYLVDGEPAHAARQLPSGKWTSKLGDLADIEHAKLFDVSGRINGQAALYFKRNLSTPRKALPPLRPKPGLVTSHGVPLQGPKIII